MPNLNGMGPRNEGPRTGMGLGNCAKGQEDQRGGLVFPRMRRLFKRGSRS